MWRFWIPSLKRDTRFFFTQSALQSVKHCFLRRLWRVYALSNHLCMRDLHRCWVHVPLLSSKTFKHHCPSWHVVHHALNNIVLHLMCYICTICFLSFFGQQLANGSFRYVSWLSSSLSSVWVSTSLPWEAWKVSWSLMPGGKGCRRWMFCRLQFSVEMA